MCARRLERLDHVFFLDVGRRSELGDRGRAAELRRELVDEARDAERELLHAPRHVDAPRAVAEVAADLADDRRHGVGGELDAPLEVESVDRLDQADRSDLDEVVDRLAAARVASRERAHERHHLLDQPVACSAVAGRAVRLEEVDVGSAVCHDHHPAPLRTSSSSSHSRVVLADRRPRCRRAASTTRRSDASVAAPSSSGPIRTTSRSSRTVRLELEASPSRTAPRWHGSASSSMRSTGRSRREPRPPRTSATTPAPRRPGGNGENDGVRHEPQCDGTRRQPRSSRSRRGASRGCV